MKYTFYGVCGSHPSCSSLPNINHTACVGIETADFILIFDAGSGIINLANDLTHSNKPIFIVFSHFHYDHIIGLPYFAPLYDPNKRVTFIYPNPKKIKSLFPKIFDPHFFPIPFDQLPKPLEVADCSFGDQYGFSLTPYQLNHPGGCYGYRFSYQNKDIIYATDNQLTRDNISIFANLFQKCDVLIHDCYFFDETQTELKTWGHTFLPDLLTLSHQANIKELCLFHFKPDIEQPYINKMKHFIDTESTKANHSFICRFPYDGLSLEL